MIVAILYFSHEACICFDRLQIGEMLGEGAFGKVCKGYLHEDESSLEPRVVAVKMLKGIHFVIKPQKPIFLQY